jgi:hypothetical protein
LPEGAIMEIMNGWDLALLVAAGYVAAITLVRLMIRRRDQLLVRFRNEMKVAQAERDAEEKKKQREQANQQYGEAA